MNSNTVNRSLHSNITPAEQAVAENLPPLLDVQPVEVPQNIEVRAELAAVEDLADHQKIEAEEALSAEKTFLENLLSLPSELQSKILEQMHMQSLDDLAPLLEAIAHEVQMLQSLESVQRPAEKISNLRQLAQLARENKNGTLQLSTSIAYLLEAIDKEVWMLKSLEGRQVQTKLLKLAQFSVENVCIEELNLIDQVIYVKFMKCIKKLSAINGDTLGAFEFKRVNAIIINFSHIDRIPKQLSLGSTMLNVMDEDIVRLSEDLHIHPLKQLNTLTGLALFSPFSDIRALGELSNLTQLMLHISGSTNIRPLGKLSNLTQLVLFISGSTNIRPLGKLSNLTCLLLRTFGSTDIDISPLGRLSNLRSLVFWEVSLTSIGPLAGLSNLTYLKFFDCYSKHNCIDISPLTQLNNLRELDVPFNSWDDDSQKILEDLKNNKNVNVKLKKCVRMEGV